MNKKDTEKFNRIFNQNYSDLKRFLIHYCTDKTFIDDILQDTFSDLYNSFHNTDDDSKYREWIYATAIKHAKNLEQKKHIESVGEIPIKINNVDNTEKIWFQENLDIIREVLTDEEYKLAYLYHVDNYTRKEIIEMLNLQITPDALHMRLTRIRAKVRRELKRKTPNWNEN